MFRQWDSLFALLGMDPLEGGLQIAREGVWPLDTSRPALVWHRMGERPNPLLKAYPPSHRVKVVLGPEMSLVEASLDQVEGLAGKGQSCVVYLPPLPAEERPGEFATLKGIVARLRGPGGCPWDREQTHDTLKGTLLEEAYEVLEALDSRDPQKLREELGDLLMQVMIHTQIAEEAGEFTMAGVIAGIVTKLIRRHPHVFGGLQAETAQQVMANWEAIKRRERPPGASTLASVPKQMPALAYAQAVQQRVARLGFDWQDVAGVVDKLTEEVQELARGQTSEEKYHELGDLLFSLVNLARWLDMDAEESLRRANERFLRRFAFIEEVCRQRGCQLKDLSFDEQDALWEMAKEKT